MSGDRGGILDREHTIAKAGFNRMLVPPGTLYSSVHRMALCFSVSGCRCRAQLDSLRPKPPDMSLVQELFTTTCDWRVASMGWMLAVLRAARRFGRDWALAPNASVRAEAGVVAALCWAGGLLIGAFGVTFISSGSCSSALASLAASSRPWLHFPVSTLIKWFSRPSRHGDRFCHRRFRRRPMIGRPLANILINYFRLLHRSCLETFPPWA